MADWGVCPDAIKEGYILKRSNALLTLQRWKKFYARVSLKAVALTKDEHDRGVDPKKYFVVNEHLRVERVPYRVRHNKAFTFFLFVFCSLGVMFLFVICFAFGYWFLFLGGSIVTAACLRSNYLQSWKQTNAISSPFGRLLNHSLTQTITLAATNSESTTVNRTSLSWPPTTRLSLPCGSVRSTAPFKPSLIAAKHVDKNPATTITTPIPPRGQWCLTRRWCPHLPTGIPILLLHDRPTTTTTTTPQTGSNHPTQIHSRTLPPTTTGLRLRRRIITYSILEQMLPSQAILPLPPTRPAITHPRVTTSLSSNNGSHSSIRKPHRLSRTRYRVSLDKSTTRRHNNSSGRGLLVFQTTTTTSYMHTWLLRLLPPQRPRGLRRRLSLRA